MAPVNLEVGIQQEVDIANHNAPCAMKNTLCSAVEGSKS
jgi:hypothetical protein